MPVQTTDKPHQHFCWQWSCATYDSVMGVLMVAGQQRPLTHDARAVLEALLWANGEWVEFTALKRAVGHGHALPDSQLITIIYTLKTALADLDSQWLDEQAQQLRIAVPITPVTDNRVDTVQYNASSAAPVIAPKNNRKSWWIITAMFALVMITMVWWQWPATSNAAPAAIQATLLVLPTTVQLTHDENSALYQGLSDELNAQYMRIPGLAVIGRTSASEFLNSQFSAAQFAQQVHASHYLHSELIETAQGLDFKVQLFRVRDQQLQWQMRRVVDQNQLYDMLTQTVSTTAEQLLTGLQMPVRQNINNPVAFQHYLQARQLARAGTEVAYSKALDQYLLALQHDPNLAMAMVGAAAIYRRQAEISQRPIAEGYRLSREYAEKALSFDDTKAQALTELAWVAFNYEHDVPTAVALFQRAITQSPSNISLIANAAILLHDLGRHADAIQLSEYVAKYDPLNSRAMANLGLNYLSAGRLDDAERSFQQALAISPKRVITHYNLGIIRLLNGDFAAALDMMQRETSESYRWIGLALVYHSLGKAPEAQAALQHLIEHNAGDSAFNIAYIYAWRGQNDMAFEWLQKAQQYRDPGLSEVLVEPMLSKIKNDPRWITMLEQIKLDPGQAADLPFDVLLPQ